jgi:tetratricopeptide (TPR) repeat protein
MEAQLRLRQEAEERNSAHQDLASWIDCVAAKGCNGVERKKIEKASTVVTFDNSLCDNERVRGNNYFTKGMYQEAIECYSRCLANKDALAVVYSNRGKKCSCQFNKTSVPYVCNHPSLYYSLSAMAYLKLKSWILAEADATSALQIDPLHYKSYQRRCVARLSLGKVRAAMMDVCAALDAATINDSALESTLMEIQQLRTKVEKRMIELPNKCAVRRVIQIVDKAGCKQMPFKLSN